MKIATKFNCKDKVFLLFQNKVHEVEIERIEIRVNKGGVDMIRYTITKNPVSDTYTTYFNEEELFATKEDLFKTL